MPYFIFQTSKVWKATRKTPLEDPTFGANSCHSHHQFLKSFPRLAPFCGANSLCRTRFSVQIFWASERWSLSLTGCKLLKTQYTPRFFPRCLEVQDCAESQENRYITTLFGLVTTSTKKVTETGSTLNRGLPLPFGGHLFVSGSFLRWVWKDHFGTNKLLQQKNVFFFQGTGSFQFTMPTPLAEVSMASEVSSGLGGEGTCWKKTVEWVGCQKMLKNGEWFVVKKSFRHLTRNGHPWIMKNLREVGISTALPKIDLKKTFAVLEREKLSPAAFARRALCLSTWVQSKPCRMRVPTCVEWSYFGASVASLLLSCQLHLYTERILLKTNSDHFQTKESEREWHRITSCGGFLTWWHPPKSSIFFGGFPL